jgi:tripartite-type tricarboxylate transporter receptor subunit TctC
VTRNEKRPRMHIASARHRRDFLGLAGATAALAITPLRRLAAASYPTSPITMILPLPAGGVLDVFAHGADAIVRNDWGQSLVLEHYPGASGDIGVERAVRAEPDGYTILLTTSSPLVSNQFLFKDMPFDPMKDLEPVILVSQSPLALVVHSSVPVKTLREYIAYAKAHPGEMNFGSSGIGSPHHIAGEFLASLAGIKLTHVPYKGSAEATADVIAGHVQSAVVSLGGILEQAKAGNVRILAITDDKRSPAAPDAPTIGEIVPGFKSSPAAWNGIFVPARTSPEIVAALNTEFNKCLHDPALVAKLETITLVPLGGTPQDVTEKIKRETAVTRLVAEKIGLRPQ